MAKKFGLGKGLDALLPLPEMETGDKNAGVVAVSLDKIAANPSQPRKFFDQTALDELAASIREHGVLQPIIVEDTSGDILSGGSYTIIAGERRFRAAKLAGLRSIPALVRSYTDEKRLAVSIIENIQRADLNPIEEAAAYKNLMDITGMTQDEAAVKLGTKRSTLANSIRLLKLPKSIQHALISGQISSGHARAILSLGTETEQENLFFRIVADNLNVRQAERMAGGLAPGGEAAPRTPDTSGAAAQAPDAGSAAADEAFSGGGAAGESGVDGREGGSGRAGAGERGGADGRESSRVTRPRDPNLDAMEQKFIEALGSKVRIDGSFDGGTIKIDYYSEDDLDRLYEIFTAR